MERRVLLAIFLAFIVLYAWQALFVKPTPKPAPGAASSTSVGRGGSPAPITGATPPPATTVPAAVAPSAAAAVVSEPAERDVRVETADVVAVFTNRGARLKSWRLKHFKDQHNEPLELVAHDLAATQPLPFSLRVKDEAVTATLNDALYSVAGVPD